MFCLMGFMMPQCVTCWSQIYPDSTAAVLTEDTAASSGDNDQQRGATVLPNTVPPAGLSGDDESLFRAAAASMGKGPAQLWCMLLLLTARGLEGARHLHKERDWGDSGDPSGLGGLVGARSFSAQPARSASRTAVTPEAAESSANSIFTGIYRPFGPSQRRSYATVESTPDVNPGRSKVTIRPRARSAQDVPGLRKAPNLGSGDEQMAVLSVGGIALAETYEGAEAVSAPDSLAMNKADGKTVIAASQQLSRPQPLKDVDTKGGKRRSYGATSGEGVGSLAMSGAANGKITLAQAGSAVAMSQTQTSTADQWQDPGRRLLSWALAFNRQ